MSCCSYYCCCAFNTFIPVPKITVSRKVAVVVNVVVVPANIAAAAKVAAIAKQKKCNLKILMHINNAL